MNFVEIISRAKSGDVEAMEELLGMYRPLILKEAIINGVLDEDLFQELQITFMRCVHIFRI